MIHAKLRSKRKKDKEKTKKSNQTAKRPPQKDSPQILSPEKTTLDQW